MEQDTLILELSDPDLRRGAQLLQSGKLVVFPTETVYGLGANALDPQACRKIFEAKGRPSDNPLIVHLSKAEDIPRCTRELDSTHLCLLERCVPGPITFVVPKSPAIPDIVTAGLPKVAIRVPSLEAARRLIEYAGVPVAAPSANRSGEPSPTTFEMAYQAMKGRVSAIFRGVPTEIGLESTVVSLEKDRLVLLRPGYVTLETLRNLGEEFGLSVVDGTQSTEGPPPSPGLKYTHYKPKATVYLFSTIEELLSALKRIQPPARLLCRMDMVETGQFQTLGKAGIEPVLFKDSSEYARGLFFEFHRADADGVPTILAWYPPPEGIGLALRNRLFKASGGRFV